MGGFLFPTIFYWCFFFFLFFTFGSAFFAREPEQTLNTSRNPRREHIIIIIIEVTTNVILKIMPAGELTVSCRRRGKKGEEGGGSRGLVETSIIRHEKCIDVRDI